MTSFKGQLLLALLLNIGLKILTFTLSMLLTRKLLPYQNGVYFTYNVYNDAVLFVAREATRNVASRVSILEDDEDDGGTQAEQQSKLRATDAAVSTETSSNEKARKRVNVAHVRRVISIALCSVPLAMIVAVALELSGICLGSASLFPSMLRHAQAGQQTQPHGDVASSEERGSDKPAMLLANVFLLLLPYLPELTVVACTVLMAFVEPCVVLVQSLNLFRVVVLAECATLTARLCTILTILYVSQRRGAEALQADGEVMNGNGLRTLWEARMALGFGQLAYAVMHVAYYAVVTSGLPMARWLGASAELQQVRQASLEWAEKAEKERAIRKPNRQATDNTTTEPQASPPPSASPPSVPPSLASVSRLYDLFAFPWCFYDVPASIVAYQRYATLLLTFLRESLLRLLLSEGESFALTSLGSEAARGYYQLIYSLGSLVARLLFRVWENACFVKWSREASLGHQRAAAHLLKLMLRLSFYVGFSFTLLGPPVTRAFLTTMYTSRWATPQVTTALQLFFHGIPLMAWNGLLEAYLRAVASPAVLQRLQRWMVAETVVYIAACYVTLMTFGKDDTQGDSVSVLVLLNVVNMLWRSSASLYLLVSSPATAVAAAAMPPSSTANFVKATSETPSAHSDSTVSANASSPQPKVRESLVQIHDFLHLFPRSVLLSIAALFVVTRVWSVSAAGIVLVGAVYGAVILARDAEVRRLLLVPLQGCLVPMLSRRRRSSASDYAAAALAEEEKEKEKKE